MIFQAMYQSSVSYHSPLGWLHIAGNICGLTAMTFIDVPAAATIKLPLALLEEAIIQLDEYFLGKRQHFSLPLAPEGTPFQQEVWRHVQQIPFGHTKTYYEIAAELGKPTASRAVGHANMRNPLAIFIPCHRVIGQQGKLTGYAGGIWRKEWLLRHERASLC